jgi:hypothetical protein
MCRRRLSRPIAASTSCTLPKSKIVSPARCHSSYCLAHQVTTLGDGLPSRRKRCAISAKSDLRSEISRLTALFSHPTYAGISSSAFPTRRSAPTIATASSHVFFKLCASCTSRSCLLWITLLRKMTPPGREWVSRAAIRTAAPCSEKNYYVYKSEGKRAAGEKCMIRQVVGVFGAEPTRLVRSCAPTQSNICT